MKLIYVEGDQDIQDLITMKLEADLGALVVECKNEANAIAYLEKHDDVDAVITDDDAALASKNALYEYCQTNRPNHPFMLIASEHSLRKALFAPFASKHPHRVVILKPISETAFLDVEIVLQNHISRATETSPYREVKIRNFSKFNSLPVDAFIKLSEKKYIKLINKDDVYSSDVISKYMAKGVSVLHVANEEYRTLADAGIRNLLGLYAKAPHGEDVGFLHLDVIENIHDQVKKYGMSEEVIELTKKTIESSVRLIKSHRGIADLLNKMQKSGGYIYDHSLRVSYLSTAIAKQTEWNSDNTCFKLSLAAMMHDMTLTDHDLARIDTLLQAKLNLLTDEQIELIKRHPKDAAMLIRNKKNLPTDVDFIVLQHHEKPDGSGFPLGMSKNRIAPFAALFILAHEYVERIEALGGVFSDENRDLILGDLRAKDYHRSNFKKAFEGLEKVMTPKKQ